MFHRFFDFILRRPGVVVFATLLLCGAGIWSALRLPIDAVPDITNTQVQVNTAVTAFAPEEIEKLITFPIETEMGGIEHLQEIRSLSKTGLSQVTLVFEEGTDLYRARQLVAERLQGVLEDLPPGLTPKLAPITTGLGEIYHYALRYRDGATEAPADPIERLRQLTLAQETVVKPALRTVPGVTEVNTSGGHDRQIVITPKLDVLSGAGLTLSELGEAIAENTANAGGGVVEKGAESVTVRTVGRVQTADEILRLPLKRIGRTDPLTVADVADVSIGSSVRTGAATHDGQEAVLGSALMLLGENSRLVALRVHERIGTLGAKLPPGMEIVTLYNRTDLVDSTIRTVERNLVEGAILVIAVLIGLLGNWRAALIVASAIPLSMLFALTGMARYGVSGNLMSLGAVDFGLIVDGAVVMAENIVRHLANRQHALGRLLTRDERRAGVLAACREAGPPTLTGVAIITVVYLPVLTLTGIEGRMFRPMAFTVLFALAGALVLSLTLVPVLCDRWLTGPLQHEDNRAVRLARRLYEPVLGLGLRRPWLVTAVATLGFAGAVWLFPRLGAEFIPQLDEGSLAVQMVRTTSIGLGASVEMQCAAERHLLRTFPEISHTFSRVGTSEVATDPMGVNVGDTYVLLHPREQWRRVDDKPITKEALAALMSRELALHFPAQANLISQPIELRFNELLSGSRADLAIKVFGDDYDTLEKIASEIREVVETIPGAAEVELDAVGRTPTLQVSAHATGRTRTLTSLGEINTEVAAAYNGYDAGTAAEGNRRYPIVVRLTESDRADFVQLGRLPVRTHDGALVRLRDVADLVPGESVANIGRDAFQRRLAVMVNLDGRDVQGFVQEVRRRLAKEVSLPAGYTIEYGGAFKNLEEARTRLLVVVPAALLLIFGLIFVAFGRLRQVAIVYSAIPLAVTGGVAALWLRDLPFSISAGIGFIALSGVAVLNGVMMISSFNLLRAEGASVREAVLTGALTRLRPVLMTALVASLGFVPMALATGAGAEVQRPLATVVIGGIVSATFLTLLLVPALYLRLEGARAEKP